MVKLHFAGTYTMLHYVGLSGNGKEGLVWLGVWWHTTHLPITYVLLNRIIVRWFFVWVEKFHVFFWVWTLVSLNKETLRHCRGADLYDHKTLADCGGRPATCSCLLGFGGKYTSLSGDCWKDLNKSPSSQNPTQGFVFLHILCKILEQNMPLLLKSILHNIPIFLTTKQTGSILVPKTWRHIRPIIYTMTLCL